MKDLEEGKAEGTKDQETEDFAAGFADEVSEEPKETEKPAEKAEAEIEEKPEEKPPEKKDETPPVDWQKEAERLRKEAEDNKAWATQVAQENATLKATKPPEKKVDEPPAKKDADEIPEDLKVFYEDYPEFKAAVEFEAKRLFKEQLGNINLTEIQGTVKDLNSNLAQERFNNTVLGGYYDEQGQYVPGHADAFKVFKTPQYQQWYEAELKRDPNAGNISDPREAIKFINRFKTEAAKAASKLDTDKDGDLEQDLSASLTSGAGEGPQAKPKRDKNDFKGGFEEEAGAA